MPGFFQCFCYSGKTSEYLALHRMQDSQHSTNSLMPTCPQSSKTVDSVCWTFTLFQPYMLYSLSLKAISLHSVLLVRMNPYLGLLPNDKFPWQASLYDCFNLFLLLLCSLLKGKSCIKRCSWAMDADLNLHTVNKAM